MLADTVTGHKQSEKEIKQQTTDINHNSGYGERDTTRGRRRPHDYLEPEPDCGERGGNLNI